MIYLRRSRRRKLYNCENRQEGKLNSRICVTDKENLQPKPCLESPYTLKTSYDFDRFAKHVQPMLDLFSLLAC